MAKKTEKVALNVWANPKTGHIHLAFADRFMSTVNNRDESQRRHKNLYRKFKTLLIQSGKWPEGMP